MSFISGGRSSWLYTLLVSVVLLGATSRAQDLSSVSLSDLVSAADRRLQNRNFDEALPILKEVLSRTEAMTDEEGRKTAQFCRFEIARILYEQGEVAKGVPYIEQYLDNEPRPKERTALAMLAQGFFEVSDWEKIVGLYERLLSYQNLDPEVLFNINLLAGQAYFQLGRYQECLEPLRYVESNTNNERIKGVCQIMVARALVELESWEQLYAWVLRLNRTERRYDISLNLTLMKAAKKLFEEEEYLNALYLYRMILPRETLLEFAEDKISTLQSQISETNSNRENDQIQSQIEELRNAVDALKDLPPYEEETVFRIGQIYSEVKRYWEGFVLFEKLCREDPDGEIGEAAAMQAVMSLYAVKQYERADARVTAYLDEKPDGIYARTLLSVMMRENLLIGNFDGVVRLRKYVDKLSLADMDDNEKVLQADLHYMLAFAYLQTDRPREAGEQFSILLEKYPDSQQSPAALYYRGMSYLFQADYANALADFKAFQEQYEGDELYPESIFREGVCLYGLERIPEAEEAFTRFIDQYPEHPVVSEAYSLRGDIEAAKEATIDDPLTLERAVADYRKAIDNATIPVQASYPAFQAAKVYKLEFKWQDIINLMNYYMNRWEDMADIAEAVYWIGQAQIQMGQLREEAIPAYIDAIMRFGNDPQRSGVDKIISELVNIADAQLTEDERQELIVRLRVKMDNTDESLAVLRLRLKLAQALLEGEDAARSLAAGLMKSVEDLSVTTPKSLSLMCDVAIDNENYAQMKRLSDYFIKNFEDSELLWHAYKARALARMEDQNYEGVLSAVKDAQEQFGVDSFMGWSQILKAKALFAMGEYEEAEKEYNTALNIPSWRGPVFAEAMYGMGECRMAVGDYKGAHNFFQRTYLLYKAYENGDWAAKGYIAAAECLIKLDRRSDAIETLRTMLNDEYTKSNALTVKVREMISSYEGE